MSEGAIVVGVDGSEESKDALRWALEEAHLRGAKLRALYAWLRPHVASRGYIPPELLDPNVLRRKAQDMLDAAVNEVAGEDPQVELAAVAAEGPAARVLIEAADDADLLVVGSRGRGGFTSLLLGSVSQQCAQHAACPVVIVRTSKALTIRER